jgi:hypothetical protein
MTLIFCLKCKTKTNTIGEIEKLSKNGRNRICGICEICGTNKTMFACLSDEKSGLSCKNEKKDLIIPRKGKYISPEITYSVSNHYSYACDGSHTVEFVHEVDELSVLFVQLEYPQNVSYLPELVAVS